MSRYRNRGLKASAALWLIVLLTWAATAGAAALVAGATVVCLAFAAVLLSRVRAAAPTPVRVRSKR